MAFWPPTPAAPCVGLPAYRTFWVWRQALGRNVPEGRGRERCQAAVVFRGQPVAFSDVPVIQILDREGSLGTIDVEG